MLEPQAYGSIAIDTFWTPDTRKELVQAQPYFVPNQTIEPPVSPPEYVVAPPNPIQAFEPAAPIEVPIIQTHRLITMANQIGQFFETNGEHGQRDAIEHIQKFWAPSMRQEMSQLLQTEQKAHLSLFMQQAFEPSIAKIIKS